MVHLLPNLSSLSSKTHLSLTLHFLHPSHWITQILNLCPKIQLKSTQCFLSSWKLGFECLFYLLLGPRAWKSSKVPSSSFINIFWMTEWMNSSSKYTVDSARETLSSRVSHMFSFPIRVLDWIRFLPGFKNLYTPVEGRLFIIYLSIIPSIYNLLDRYQISINWVI